VTINDQIAEGDKVVTRWTATGTHKGALMGIAPTGKHTTVTGIAIERYQGGKVVEAWQSGDTLGMLQQLRAVPTMAPASTSA
jgi:predicted ester cyclase